MSTQRKPTAADGAVQEEFGDLDAAPFDLAAHDAGPDHRAKGRDRERRGREVHSQRRRRLTAEPDDAQRKEERRRKQELRTAEPDEARRKEKKDLKLSNEVVAEGTLKAKSKIGARMVV